MFVFYVLCSLNPCLTKMAMKPPMPQLAPKMRAAGTYLYWHIILFFPKPQLLYLMESYTFQHSLKKIYN